MSHTPIFANVEPASQLKKEVKDELEEKERLLTAFKKEKSGKMTGVKSKQSSRQSIGRRGKKLYDGRNNQKSEGDTRNHSQSDWQIHPEEDKS